MKTIKIDGKMAKVFVLKETDNNIVYIPLTHIDRVDYNRLLDIEAQGGEMLNAMRKTTLDNGRNALKQYDDIIQVLHFHEGKGIRMPKPEEGLLVHQRYEDKMESIEKSESKETTKEAPKETKSSTPETSTTQEAPKRKRGRPPKAKPQEES